MRDLSIDLFSTRCHPQQSQEDTKERKIVMSENRQSVDRLSTVTF